MENLLRANIELGGGRKLNFTRTLIMGIVNCTPDSFYPSSRHAGKKSAVAAANSMIGEGADILDFGGESTRPGAEYVDAPEQIRRVVPVISEIRAHSDIPVSVDTREMEVARAAIDAGADIINDVSGLRDDTNMARFASQIGVPVILMHMRGTSRDMQINPHYVDTIGEICRELNERVDIALKAGIARDRIILDPGIGFGKRLEDNLQIISHIERIRELGFPVLLGVSRKSFIDRVLQRPVEQRLYGTLAAEAWAVMRGVEIVRVHDVAATVDMVRMLESIRDVSVDNTIDAVP